MAVFKDTTSLTDEMMDEMRAMVGKTLRIEQYNHEATYDSIRHYAFGIGDDNPLWCDPEYAARGPFGIIVAPPTFFYSVFAPGIAPGLPGLQPFQAGGELSWKRLPRRGEAITAEARFTGFDEHVGKNAGKLIIQHGEVNYRTGEGELLATFKSHSYRTIRKENADGGGLSYKPQSEYAYSDEELARIEQDVRAEDVRGAEPRLWQDVQIGDLLTPVVKGPLNQITMTVYYAGALATAGYKACEIKWKQWIAAAERPETVPNNYDRTYFSERVLPSLGHQNNDVARALGMPGAYDNGHQRTGWMAHVVTNWMGDHGFLAELSTRIRRPNIFGNTTWVRGRVVGKEPFLGKPAVQIELWAEDQLGTVNTTGTATVILPDHA